MYAWNNNDAVKYYCYWCWVIAIVLHRTPGNKIIDWQKFNTR